LPPQVKPIPICRQEMGISYLNFAIYPLGMIKIIPKKNLSNKYLICTSYTE